MKSLSCARGILLALSLSVMTLVSTACLYSEAKVVTLPDGTVVFQLDRSDMEACVIAQEDAQTYQEGYESMKALAESQGIQLEEKDKKIKSLERTVTWVGIGGVVLSLLSFVLGGLLSR